MAQKQNPSDDRSPVNMDNPAKLEREGRMNTQPPEKSPVKTELNYSNRPAPGQTGHIPQTVAEHNADVDAASEKVNPRDE